jgi:hypothetical protein
MDRWMYEVPWGLIADAFGVIAFLGIAWIAFRRRVVWLWRPSYTVSHIEAHTEGGLIVTLIGRHGGPGAKFISHVSLKATVRGIEPIEPDLIRSWRAKFIPQDGIGTTFVLPEGDSVHQIRLRLVGLAEDEAGPFNSLPFTDGKLEQKNVRLIISWPSELEFELVGSEGDITLYGNTLQHPVAVERPSIWRRLARVLP